MGTCKWLIERERERERVNQTYACLAICGNSILVARAVWVFKVKGFHWYTRVSLRFAFDSSSKDSECISSSKCRAVSVKFTRTKVI